MRGDTPRIRAVCAFSIGCRVRSIDCIAVLNMCCIAVCTALYMDAASAHSLTVSVYGIDIQRIEYCGVGCSIAGVGGPCVRGV